MVVPTTSGLLLLLLVLLFPPHSRISASHRPLSLPPSPCLTTTPPSLSTVEIATVSSAMSERRDLLRSAPRPLAVAV